MDAARDDRRLLARDATARCSRSGGTRWAGWSCGAPIACDVEAVLDAVAGSRAAIEISGDPYRLDLPPAWIPAARRRNMRFVISTDAHAIGDLDNLAYGVAMARRGACVDQRS